MQVNLSAVPQNPFDLDQRDIDFPGAECALSD